MRDLLDRIVKLKEEFRELTNTEPTDVWLGGEEASELMRMHKKYNWDLDVDIFGVPVESADMEVHVVTEIQHLSVGMRTEEK